VPLFVTWPGRDDREMLYKRPSLWSRLHRHRGFQVMAAVAAGFHAANGIRHGVQPSPWSAARALEPGRRVADRIEKRLWGGSMRWHRPIGGCMRH